MFAGKETEEKTPKEINIAFNCYSFTLEDDDGPKLSPFSRVSGNVYLGRADAAYDRNALAAAGIKAIVSLGSAHGEVYPRHPGIHYLHIIVEDNEAADIRQHFGITTAFIRLHSTQGGVLVHCSAGISRSPTIVAAWLMTEQRISLAEALRIIRQFRPDVDPNPGFLRQLQSL